MVGAIDTIFIAAVTVVPVVVKMVCMMRTMVSIPETTVCANEKMFLTAGTIFLAPQKIV
jgi:hypothetical protein